MSWLIVIFLKLITFVNSATYSVHVNTTAHVNEIADEFLSLSVDPKYLFTTNEKYNSDECICMASSLSPGFIRIAGPSTADMVFQNYSIMINPKSDESQNQRLKVSPEQWQMFAKWAKSSDFKLVFALNPDERMSTGVWNANSALSILTTADKSEIDDVVWQLGYECSNQTIEEYLNDLETLKIIIETFRRGQSQHWKVVGGDVSNCLQTDSKSDFKDYVTLSNEMMDAILFNANSSSHELEQMSESDRTKLLKLLSKSSTPLWMTEKANLELTEMDRAVDWMISLGYSARNGFSVNFRELRKDEIYEPTLSFYMALLYKNLVGNRVLSIDIDPDRSSAFIFAHCTSLRHKPIPGAVTLYAANVDNEPARFSIKLPRTEEGGDIMQFILGHDNNGNIIVNGRPMYYEGDIRPIVKRVRPYKTLLLTLPPKSFGFWVLANTKMEACQTIVSSKIEEVKSSESISASEFRNKTDSEDHASRRKRSVINNIVPKNAFDKEFSDFIINSGIKNPFPFSAMKKSRSNLRKEDDSINANLENTLFNMNKHSKLGSTKRIKRQNSEQLKVRDTIEKDIKPINKPKRTHLIKKFSNGDNTKRPGFLSKLLRLGGKRNITRQAIKNRSIKNNISQVFKRNIGNNENRISKYNPEKKEHFKTDNAIKNRMRRSVMSRKDGPEEMSNDINIDDSNENMYKMLHKIKKSIQNIPVSVKTELGHEKNKSDKVENDSNDIEDEIVIKTTINEDNAMINLKEKSNHRGLLMPTVKTIKSLLQELREKMDKAWGVIHLLD